MVGRGFRATIVRSTKCCLRKALGQAKFSHDELLTSLIKIEMVLNSRPLTYISSSDLEEPITVKPIAITAAMKSQRYCWRIGRIERV